MRRALALLLLGTACAGREVSKIRYTSTDCPDPSGCEAPMGAAETFHAPDESRAPIADAAAPAPAPTCETVAIALTALELGNYATERDEAMAKHRRACTVARLDPREMACVSMATKEWHVGYCTRRLGAPAEPIELVDTAGCKAIVAHMQDRTGPHSQAMQRKVYGESCALDGWPVGMRECLWESYDHHEPLWACGAQIPPWLQQQIVDRLARLAADEAATK